jgi:hypothetical protein
MSALDRVREKFGNLEKATDRTDKRPSVSSVSALPRKSGKFGALGSALTERIRQMGERWQYSPEDLAQALDAARADPAGWLASVEWDEQLHRKCGRTGLRWPG